MKGITRRDLLRAAGIAVAVPWLESLLPREAFAADAGPLRAAFVFLPNGVIQPSFTPKETGAKFALPATLAALEPVQKHVSVLSGLALDNARAKGDGPGDHARSSAAFLTCAHPRKTAGKDIRLGVSVDQVLATAIGKSTRMPSLELGCDRGRRAGQCDSGYSCAYTSNISWTGESTPSPKEVNPRLVFERLFGSEDARRNAANRAERLRRRKSVLDYVREDAARLEKRLSGSDRQKLIEYEDSIREIERRIEREEAAAAPAADAPGMDAPAGIPRSHTEHVDLMYDLLALAFRMDATRVASFMVENAGSNRSYRELGVPEGHHQLSHHKNDRAKIEKIARIDRFHMERFARFIGKLAEMREGDGALLDRSIIVLGSGIGDGNRHTHHDLPILLAGRGGGALTPGRHLRYPKNTPLANLYLKVLREMGAPAERFVDSTGEIARV